MTRIRTWPLVALGVLGVGAVLFLGSVFHSLPSNVLAAKGVVSPVRTFSVNLAPQGWAFFTKSPSEAGLTFVDGGDREGVTSLMVTPQARTDNLLGLSRTQRAQGPEGAELLLDTADDQWHGCDIGASVGECIDAMRTAEMEPHEIRNPSPVPTLCGDVIAVRFEPVDWSYREFYEVDAQPRQVVPLRVGCDEEK